MAGFGRWTLFILVSSLIILVGCGGGGSSANFAPPPTGPFSNASLSGAYAFSFSGTNTGGFFSMTGSLQANGNGVITGGLADINSFSGIFLNQSVSGTYTVRSNGQAAASLNTPVGSFSIDFVMISTQRALVMRFNNNATASGSMDLQNAGAFTLATLTGPFAFNVNGIDASGRTLESAGAFTTNGAGTITTGVQDFNDNGTVNTNLALTGSFALAGTNGRGIGSLTTSLGTLNFVFYIVDANRVKLMETDTVPVLAGDAFRQQGPFSNASLSGAMAMTVGGASANRPYVAGAVFTADGAGNITSGIEDINNSGTINQNVALTGTYSVATNGRGTLSLITGLGTSNFIVYPSTSGLQMLEVDVTVASSGAAFSQTGGLSNGSIQGTYGWNLTGATSIGEVDSNAQFSADGAGHLSGAADFNNVGALSSGLNLTGSYSLPANGRGAMTMQSSFGPQNFQIYAVSGSRVLFIEVDSNLVAVGAFEHQ